MPLTLGGFGGAEGASGFLEEGVEGARGALEQAGWNLIQVAAFSGDVILLEFEQGFDLPGGHTEFEHGFALRGLGDVDVLNGFAGDAGNAGGEFGVGDGFGAVEFVGLSVVFFRRQ